MVRCQRVNGSVIAHGDFYSIFKDNVKFLESHGDTQYNGINNGINNSNIIANPNQPNGNNSNNNNHHSNNNNNNNSELFVLQGPTTNETMLSSLSLVHNVGTIASVSTNTTAQQNIIISEAMIDQYLLTWSRDVLIYKDHVVKKHIQKCLEQNEKEKMQLSANPDGIATTTLLDHHHHHHHHHHLAPSTSTTIPMGLDSSMQNSSSIDRSNDLSSPQQTTRSDDNNNNTSPIVGNLTQAQLEYGLNTFRSLSLQNRKSVALKSKATTSNSTSIRLSSQPTVTITSTTVQPPNLLLPEDDTSTTPITSPHREIALHSPAVVKPVLTATPPTSSSEDDGGDSSSSSSSEEDN
jgi:hypothetical protein